MKSGLDLTGVNPNIRPQDDLYLHVNGAWMDSAEIPSDRPSDGAFYRLRDQSEANIREIIEESARANSAPGSEARKVGDLYASFMDEATIEKLGINPLQADIDRVLSLSHMEDFARLLGELSRRGVSGPIGTFIDIDMMNSEEHILYLEQSGLGLPDESYYREDKYAEIREKYVKHIATMLELANFSDSSGMAERIFKLEKNIAEFHYDVVRHRDLEASYNKYTRDELLQLVFNFNWSAWLEAMGAPQSAIDSVVVRQPEFQKGINDLLSSDMLPIWKEWMIWHMISGAAPYLSSPFVNENFSFYGTALSGTPELKARWKRGVALVEGVLGEAVGQLYVAKHFPPAAKERMSKLVDNLVEAYRVEISHLSWMSEVTRKRALEKLAKFTPKIGYPDKWRDYSKLEIVTGDLLGNVNRATSFEIDRAINKLGKPVDRTEWEMTPQTVNAYYHPMMNEIVFPAAILQPPFFDMDADDAANYGGIGAVIGHEIGHGFDDQGSKFDGDGNINNWWSDEDREAFEKLTGKLIHQYNECEPIAAPGHKVNGAFTIGENIGDLGGLNIAIKAYSISLAGKEPPIIEGLTGMQRLFYGWAQVWQIKIRTEAAIQRIATDPHSPGEVRCNAVVRNVAEFYEAFGVKESDQLFLEPAQRVRIW
mgnify:FL=1